MASLRFILLPALALSGSVFGQDNRPAAVRDSVPVGGGRFTTDGPIRYAPVTSGGRTYVGSDDGHLYCLDASTGKVLWKFRGGPPNRKVLGAGRLISAWPVSGGPVVHEGKVYFAAGIWPVMGVFVYALDAESGSVVWVNDRATALWKSKTVSEQRKDQPEFEPSFISVSPMGRLSVAGDRLVVPCGRALPAYFDLKTGDLIEFHYGRKAPHKKGDGAPVYPDFDAIADARRGCFPRDATADAIVDASGVREGYALIVGADRPRMIEGLVATSRLRIVVLDRDPGRIAALRTRLAAKEAYAVRASAHVGEPASFGLPPYVFSLIVSAGSGETLSGIRSLFRALRPYGGTAVFLDKGVPLASAIRRAELQGGEVSRSGRFTLLRRAGRLPGADDWSHEFANAANTRSSRDDRVKSPFAVLWFGGPAGEIHRYYENHRGYAVPKVAGGRVFVEGPKLITAFDVYTGRLLWEWRPGPEDKEIWSYFARNVHWVFEPLAGRVTASEDAVYVVSDFRLHALDARTGRPLRGFRFEDRADWGGVRIVGDTLYLPTAGKVLALDRRTGKVRWKYEGSGGTLAVGNAKVFCIQYPWPDRFNNAHIGPKGRWTKFIENWEKIKRRGGDDPVRDPKLVALHAATGRKIWEKVVPSGRNVVRRLAYSEKHDLLFPLGNRQVYRGRDGEAVWKTNQTDRAMISGDLFWGYGNMSAVVDMATRKYNERVNPLTAAPQSWKLRKTGNGCGPVIAGTHLLTFRSGSGAYYDLEGSSGVVNLGAFRSSCQPSLIPANGVLVSPNSASGGCTCKYPIATALALVHAPEMEKWGSYGELEVKQAIRRVGINFGAPGDRMDDGGTLWLDYPSVGGPSPRVEVRTEPADPEWFRRHVSRVAGGEGLNWVVASGARGLKSVKIVLGGEEPRSYRVRVTYAVEAGEGKLRGEVRESRGIRVNRVLECTFEEGKRVCGIEIVDETLLGKKK